jgi:hypothetical protein
VTLPTPAAVLRHGPEARLVRSIARLDRRGIACTSRGRGLWRWPRMLEGAAQAAGLLVGLAHADAPRAPVIAEYRDVVVRAASHRGPLRFFAALERRVLHCWRCTFEVRDGRGRVLLAGRVTLAPPRHGEGG